MKLINRSAFAIWPKQAFADWANSLPADEEGFNQTLTLEEHLAEGTVYLIDEVENEQDFSRALEANWQQIFENELSAWDEFGDHWPAQRSRELFDTWFDVRPQIMALDLSAQPLLVAALDGEA